MKVTRMKDGAKTIIVNPNRIECIYGGYLRLDNTMVFPLSEFRIESENIRDLYNIVTRILKTSEKSKYYAISFIDGELFRGALSLDCYNYLQKIIDGSF